MNVSHLLLDFARNQSMNQSICLLKIFIDFSKSSSNFLRWLVWKINQPPNKPNCVSNPSSLLTDTFFESHPSERKNPIEVHNVVRLIVIDSGHPLVDRSLYQHNEYLPTQLPLMYTSKHNLTLPLNQNSIYLIYRSISSLWKG